MHVDSFGERYRCLAAFRSLFPAPEKRRHSGEICVKHL